MTTTLKTAGRVLTFIAVLTIGSMMNACTSDEPNPNGVDGGNGNNVNKNADPEVTYIGTTAYSEGILFNKGTELGNGDQEFVFTGDVTLEAGTYLLKGWVYVGTGAKLRIPAGTIIKGDKQTKAALIVEPGGYVEMKGTNDKPIVMTSAAAPGDRRPGDWGGLIICGKAKNNQQTQQIEGGPRTIHGGDNDDDNSGIFQYLRVEFAGYPLDTDKEINGVTLGSVGRKTTIDHIQVSYSNDDSFEWFGGTVNCSNLVAYKGWDDDFDTDNGFSGTVQYALSIRDARIADTSQSNGFESDNNATGADVAPFTSATFRNVTLIGPITERNADFQNSADYITGGTVNPNNGSKLGKFQSAMQIRRSSKINIENLLAVGFPIGVIIDGDKGRTPDYARNGEFHLKNVWMAGMTVLGSDANKKYEDELLLKDKDGNVSYDPTQYSFSHSFFLGEASNRELASTELELTDPKNIGQNYCPATILSDGNGGYIGAFREAGDSWLDSWTNFDPQNTAY